MGRKKRYQVGLKQRKRRKQRRVQMQKKGQNPDSIFRDGHFIKVDEVSG